MFESRAAKDALQQVQAINHSQAVIEFAMDGTIVTANDNFLSVLGYTLDEIKGKHHSIFVDAQEREQPAYRTFWQELNQGKFQVAQYKRIGKGGREVWIQASYNPVMEKGKPIKVIKFATDITPQKMRDLEADGKFSAMSKAQAVIEFNMDGTIVTANDNFLKTMEYSLADIQGQHHRMFVQSTERDGEEYKQFWKQLQAGNFQSAEFKRITKTGREIWILASYNPILDSNGRPFKVVKIATDVTAQKLSAADDSAQIVAIQKALAVIEFKMDGTIMKANQNFLDAMGYRLDEIVGRHHRMCIDPAERNSPEFAQFWADLNKGIYQASEYKRIGQGGREIWIQASYNPVFDLNGRPYKVVKYATNITQSVVARMRAERARSMIETVAAGSEEMSASIREISETMVKSRQTADAAVHQVAQADAQAARLTGAAGSMEGIVQLIGAITGQINLLALNATIESARAGDAGRGFAVVASEVKNLANQARGATEKITAEIESLNGISGDVVATFDAIKDAFHQVNEFVTSTAAAVEEQATVIEDMSSNMQRAVAELA